MSDVLYPVGKIESLEVTMHDRTLVDDFEDGSSSARRMWAEKHFKRRFKIQHTPLTESEFGQLRSFFGARNGRYDSFWFRDNVHRSGNAMVRLAKPFVISKNGSRQYRVELELEEVSPSRILPDRDDILGAAGVYPTVWWDANRELYQLHAASYSASPVTYDASATGAEAYWGGSYTHLNIGNPLSSYQTFKLGDYNSYMGPYVPTWAQTQTTFFLEPFSTAASIFAIVKNPAGPTGVVFSVGIHGPGKNIGLQLSGDKYRPWLGGADTWSTAVQNNSPADTFRSIGLTWANGSNTCKLYCNGVFVGAETNTRGFLPGPAALGSGVFGVNTFYGPYENHCNHPMFLASELAAGQMAALHNLFAHQYGLPKV